VGPLCLLATNIFRPSPPLFYGLCVDRERDPTSPSRILPSGMSPCSVLQNFKILKETFSLNMKAEICTAERKYTPSVTTNFTSLVKTIPTHALFIKTLIVLKKIKPYICFGQLTGHLQGQLAFHSIITFNKFIVRRVGVI
jgi:hypothetical protein